MNMYGTKDCRYGKQNQIDVYHFSGDSTGGERKIKMRNGGEYEARVDMPKGHGVLTPPYTAEKKAKFFDNVDFSNTIPGDRAEKALGLLERLEEVDDVTEVFKLLVL